MDLIVTHQVADFDALASMIAASKLYPDSKLMLPGAPEKRVGEFLKTYSDLIKIEKEKTCDISDIDRLIMVDTRLAGRIGKAAELISKDIPVLVYDHHPRTGEDINATGGISEQLGATVTILVDQIRRKRLKISPLEATIMALGIYEDTGSLTYLSTTEKDMDALSFLLSRGADLKAISSYLNWQLTPSQTSRLVKLLGSVRIYQFMNKRVIINSVSSDRYVQDLALLTHKLRDLEGCDAIFSLVELPDRIQMVARSHSIHIDVGQIATQLGGGGHNLASSAVIRVLSLRQVEEKILNLLSRQLKTKFSSVRRIILDQMNSVTDEVIKPLLKKDLAAKLKKTLPERLYRILRLAGRIADENKTQAFAVGGFVRDLIMGVKNLDVDIVVEGDMEKFAKKLAKQLKGALVLHRKFKTATVVMKDKSKVDIAASRTERYDRPAALPEVDPARIRADLARRDFTINTMAIKLNSDCFGELLDFFDGQRDLRDGRIRALHRMSFVEDPTRIFRAVRFESRYNFRIDRFTEHLIKTAVSYNMFARVSGERLREEVVLILKEKEPLKSLKRMAELHELRFIHPMIHFVPSLSRLLKRTEDVLKWYKVSFPKKHLEVWLVYFLSLIDQLDLNQTEELLQRFPFRRKEQSTIRISKNSDEAILNNLAKTKVIQPSRVYSLLRPLPKEAILKIMAKTPILRVRSRISDYLLNYLHLRLKIKGKDLKREGFKPGPEFGRVLEMVLYARLDGRVKTRSDELGFVRRLAKRHNRK